MAPVGPGLAVARAEATDQPVVIDTLTTSDTLVSAEPDGTFEASLAAGPVRVPDPSQAGAWIPIDTTLVPGSSGLSPTAGAAQISFSSGAGEPMATMAIGEHPFVMRWNDPLPVPTVTGSTATYLGVQPGMDLTLTARPSGFEQSLILHQVPAAPIVVQLPLDLHGLTADLNGDGFLSVTDPKGQVVAQADPARMWDASRDEVSGESQHVATVQERIVDTPDGPALEITPDPGFLNDPNLVYPVTIDPTPSLSVTDDTYVDSANATTTYSSATTLDSGTPNGTAKSRSLLKFPIDAFAGTDVLDAHLDLYETWSSSCTASQVNVQKVTSSWSPSTNWNTQPSYGTVYAKQTVAKGFSGSCPAASVTFTNTGTGHNLGELAQDWADGSTSNNGIAVRADNESATNGWKRFTSSDNASNVPVLTVHYNSYPNTPDQLSPADGGYVNTITPTLHGTMCDPDANKGRVNFQIWNTAHTTELVHSVTTRDKVSSCLDHPWKVPGSTLSNATAYDWRARTDDGTDVSGWTAWQRFTVDTNAPSSPTISSSTHPSQSTWYGVSATSFSASWTGASDSGSGVAGYAVTFDQNATSTSSLLTQTGTSFSTTIANSGTWYLHVRTVDAAGNASSEATFTVHVAGGFLSPQPGDAAQQSFTLQVKGPSADTQATIEYRRSPDDAAGWQNLPTADVSSGGSPISSWPVSLTGGVSSVLTWDADSTLGGDAGPVQLQVSFGTSDPTTSSPIDLLLDRVSFADTAQIGPGSLDLVTGNLNIGAADVSLGNLSIARSFDSRDPDYTPDPTQTTDGIFGPGWNSGLEASSSFALLREKTSPGTVAIWTAEGGKLSFVRKTDGSWVASPVPDPTAILVKLTSPTRFQLSTADGTVTTFTKPSGSSDYVPTETHGSGSNSTTTLSYQVSGGVAQPTQMLDVVPSGLGSSCSSLVRGCRALTLTYATSTTATGTPSWAWGDVAGQVSSISFTGWDPASTSMQTVDVADYLYDSEGRLRAEWDPRISPALKITYGYDSAGHITSVTPPGLDSWTISYGTVSGDGNTGRVLSVSHPGEPTGTATTTIVYQVPLTGSGAPYDMGSSDVVVWGQADVPAYATAIFPPLHDPSTPPTDYDYATVNYLDVNGSVVNSASSDGSSGGYISTTEYDGFGNLVRELSPRNRAEALATGSTDAEHQAAAALFDTQYVYASDGVKLTDSYGPLHTVVLDDDTQVEARQYEHYAYDETAPSGVCPCYLPTTTTEGALVLGTSSDVDVRTATTDYDWGTSTSGGTLQPTVETTDPSGLNLRSKTFYDAAGRITETRMPAGPSGGDAHSSDSYYYTTDTSSGLGACNSTPEWAGALCETKPAAQPSTGGDLPITTYTYDLWGDVATTTETVPSASATRTTTVSYDGAGRPIQTNITGPGASVPDVFATYDPDTGLSTETYTDDLSIERGYDALGRLTSYTDSDGNTSTYEYDLQGRPDHLDDGKGSYDLTYDDGTERRGLLTSISDSDVGDFTANYDADGNLVSQTFPNEMTATTTYDSADAPVDLEYLKSTYCSTDCTWYSDQAASTIHDQWALQNSSLSAQTYSYDAAGRLSTVQDTLASGAPSTSCTNRQYGYDDDSNRTSLDSYPPDPSTGACSTSTTPDTNSSTYDAADRPSKSGYSYDAFGRITEVPAVDNGGEDLTATYYANDRVETLTQAGTSSTMSLDPLSRFREVDSPTAVYGSEIPQVSHFSNDGDSPSWIDESHWSRGHHYHTAWTRYVSGPDGLMHASVDQDVTVHLQLTDLHGDVVGTAGSDPSAGSMTSAGDQTEFGSPHQPGVDRYGWLGGYQRATDTPTGGMLMGARVYLPSLGRFLQTDPVLGGSSNDYDYARQDPMAVLDLQGYSATDRLHLLGWAKATMLEQFGLPRRKSILR